MRRFGEDGKKTAMGGIYPSGKKTGKMVLLRMLKMLKDGDFVDSSKSAMLTQWNGSERYGNHKQ